LLQYDQTSPEARFNLPIRTFHGNLLLPLDSLIKQVDEQLLTVLETAAFMSQ
jgi:hypothetical protein